MRADRLQHSELRFVEIARALMLRPAFLMLDEPAAGLSAEEIRRLGDLIKCDQPRGTGVLLVEHHADLIFDICDRVTVLNLGKVLAAGTPAEIRSHREVVNAYLGALNRCSRSRPVGRLRQDRRAERHRAHGRRGRSRGAARPQRRRQDHVAAGDLRPAAAHRHDPLCRPGHDSASPRETVHAGLVHVVEGHRVFTQLSVLDNLLLAGYGMPRAERAAQVEEALAFFPEIAAKRNDRAVTLSGGQQQMLAVAQGLVRRPRLLMLDEPSAGLSPVLVDRVLAAAARLRDAGTAVLLVEQLIEKALAARRPRLCAGARLDRARSARRTRTICPTAWSMPTFGADVSAPLASSSSGPRASCAAHRLMSAQDARCRRASVRQAALQIVCYLTGTEKHA